MIVSILIYLVVDLNSVTCCLQAHLSCPTPCQFKKQSKQNLSQDFWKCSKWEMCFSHCIPCGPFEIVRKGCGSGSKPSLHGSGYQSIKEMVEGREKETTVGNWGKMLRKAMRRGRANAGKRTNEPVFHVLKLLKWEQDISKYCYTGMFVIKQVRYFKHSLNWPSKEAEWW